jgi:hypothetical protein
MSDADGGSSTLYMVGEHFKNKDALAVYRRFRDNGRMAPEGLLYISSWVDHKMERCSQLMKAHDLRLLDDWMAPCPARPHAVAKPIPAFAPVTTMISSPVVIWSPLKSLSHIQPY